MLEDNDDSSIDSNTLQGSTDQSSLTEHPMACHPNSRDDEEEDKEEEHFPTASLDGNVWMKEPVLDRHLCIHEHSQHDLCPYSCPYSLDQLLLAQHYAPTPQYMDLSYIYDFPDVITNASNEDIPNLEDVLKLII